MSKWFKKATAIVLTAAMALSFGSPVFATDNVDIDNALLERGYPQIILENMPQVAKQSLYEKEDAIFSGGSITTYNQESGEYVSYEIPDNGVMTIGQIPEEDLTLTCATSIMGPTEVLVVQSYEWNNLPAFRWQDPISVSWNDSIFEYQSGSFHKVDMYDGLDDGQTPYYGAVKSEQYSYASASDAGLTWYADLKGYDAFDEIIALYGYGEFLLEEKGADATGTSRLYVHYVHPTVSATLGVTIPGVGVFNVSGAGAYDEIGDDYYFSY